MREAYNILANIAPDLDVEGEMRANVALNPELRRRIFTNARFNDRANLLVFPNLDAANSAFNLLVELGDGLPVGPILVGPAKPAHVLSPAVSTRESSTWARLPLSMLNCRTPRPNRRALPGQCSWSPSPSPGRPEARLHRLQRGVRWLILPIRPVFATSFFKRHS